METISGYVKSDLEYEHESAYLLNGMYTYNGETHHIKIYKSEAGNELILVTLTGTFQILVNQDFTISLNIFCTEKKQTRELERIRFDLIDRNYFIFYTSIGTFGFEYSNNHSEETIMIFGEPNDNYISKRLVYNSYNIKFKLSLLDTVSSNQYNIMDRSGQEFTNDGTVVDHCLDSGLDSDQESDLDSDQESDLDSDQESDLDSFLPPYVQSQETLLKKLAEVQEEHDNETSTFTPEELPLRIQGKMKKLIHNHVMYNIKNITEYDSKCDTLVFTESLHGQLFYKTFRVAPSIYQEKDHPSFGTLITKFSQGIKLTRINV
ncbi:hypothetical protein [Salmon gill poxvirus]